MKQLLQTNQFLKDIKRMKKRGKDIIKLKEVVKKVYHNEPLDSKYRDHSLRG